MLSLQHSESAQLFHQQQYQTPTYHPYLTPSSSESTDYSSDLRILSSDSPLKLGEKGDLKDIVLQQQQYGIIELKQTSSTSLASNQTMAGISLADKVRIAIQQQIDDEIKVAYADAPRFESQYDNGLRNQYFINQSQRSDIDNFDDSSTNSQNGTLELPRVRPQGGIKFSKSAASLAISDSSNVSDSSCNNTPTSGIRKMRFQDFQIVSVVGQGSYGKVYHVVPKTKSLTPGFQVQNSDKAPFNAKTQSSQSLISNCSSFALKVIDKKYIQLEEKQHEVHTEKFVLSYLKSPSIIKFYSSFQDKHRLYFLLEYMPNGSLYDFLKREQVLTVQLSRHFAAELVGTLECIRNSEIIHRDLKPGNVLLDNEYHLKLIDFQTSKILNQNIASRIPRKKTSHNSNDQNQQNMAHFHEQRNYSLVGTEEYVSPEILQDREATYSSDLWSLGIIIFQFLTGKTPFKGQTEFITFENIINKEVEFPIKFPVDAKDLVEKLLNKDPALRIGASDLEELKKHSFFNGINFKTMRETEVPLNSINRVKACGNMKRFYQNSKVTQSFKEISDDQVDEESHDCSDTSVDIQCQMINELNKGKNLLDILDRQNSFKNEDRKRSISFQGSKLLREQQNCIVLKSGLLKKKGIIFYNNRMVTLNARGILTYYDPKNMTQPRGKIDLNNQTVIVKFHGKNKDYLEIITPNEVYIFKEMFKGQDVMKEWQDQIRRFIKIDCV